MATRDPGNNMERQNTKREDQTQNRLTLEVMLREATLQWLGNNTIATQALTYRLIITKLMT